MHVRSLPSLLAELPAEAGIAVVRDGDTTLVGVGPNEVVVADGEAALAELDRIERSDGLWTGYLAYDLGRAIERIDPRADDDRRLPDLVFARHGAWLAIDTDGAARVVGDAAGEAATLLRSAVWRARRNRTAPPRARATEWSSSLDRAGHAAAVAQVRDLLAAGACYQVNLTRRITHGRAFDPVALFGVLAEEHPAPHAALLTFGTRGPAVAVVSASPELFLRIDGDRLETRPIKGTDRDASRLVTSAKDAAEHVMIVDLARNDLGRVCRPGSVQVPVLMAVESHPGLHHLVSTVVGTRRPAIGLGDVVRALFPAASITGAPKPRVMQAIEDLEPIRRGVYCGAVGWIAPAARRVELSVAIRTFTVTARHTDLGVGGGIVADSSAADEWDETALKAARLLEVAAGAIREEASR